MIPRSGEGATSPGTVLDLRERIPKNHLWRPSGVAEAAERCLRRSSYLAVRAVSCEYHRGVLVLRGRLSTYYQKQLAQEAVAGIEGVSQVVNEIEVI